MYSLTEKQLFWITVLISLLFVSLPLLVQLPFRDNVYVSWEGAYRLYIGQLPFKDFGIPVGPGMWIMPAIFFKIFGPYVYTLVITQVFLNFISLISLRSILNTLRVKPEVILVSILLLCLSYIMINFWPWYNQSVFVYQLVGTALLLKGLYHGNRVWGNILVFLSGLFLVWSLFTKQDGGALGILICGILLVVYTILTRKFVPLLVWVASLTLFLLLAIVPFLPYDFSYWFNYGQFPHYSRVSAMDLLNDWFMESKWIKFFILSALVLIVLSYRHHTLKSLWSYWKEHTEEVLLNLFTLGILVQAAIIQVTSFSPPEGNFYFYTFGVMFLLHRISLGKDTSRVWIVGLTIVLVSVWWSDNYWKYTSKVFAKFLPKEKDRKKEVSKHTWADLGEEVKFPPQLQHTWTTSEFEVLKNMKLPPATLEGIRQLKKNPIWQKENLRVLNMTEITFLAKEFNFVPEHNSSHPLWFHKHVGMFDREVEYLCGEIEKGTYDVILFEPIPYLRDYFTNAVHDCAKEHYEHLMGFPAPKVDTESSIQVYLKK
jgi:hypothetical protein